MKQRYLLLWAAVFVALSPISALAFVFASVWRRLLNAIKTLNQ